MKRFYAHTPNEENPVWHLLRNHLIKVSSTTRTFTGKFGAESVGRFIGLMHDIGKYHPSFQRYLRDSHLHAQGVISTRPVSHPHSMAGAVSAARLLISRSLGQHLHYLPLVIAGHHTGLGNAFSVLANVKEGLSSVADTDLLTEVGEEIQGLIVDEEFVVPSWVKTNLELELFLRMLLSALVDADRLDAEQHFSPAMHSLRRFSTPRFSELYRRLSDHIERLNLASSITIPAHVQQVRSEVYDACIVSADKSQGIFRLTSPTGAGKTLSALGFALKHVIKHDLERVVFAAPFSGIVDQTADLFRRILGSEAVLEHHSDIDFGVDESTEESNERWKLAVENWDLPVVVTTTVQLLESLFSNKPSKVRKIHRLAKSVIVLDEAHTIPIELLRPTMSVLESLALNYGTTIVLSTATPISFSGSFSNRDILAGVQLRELVPQYKEHFEVLGDRVEYDQRGTPFTYEVLAEELAAHEQVLAIVNSRRAAVELTSRLREVAGEESVFHLSRLLCPAHRRDVLTQVNSRLERGLPCRLVSTSIVEAGIDISFPILYREQASLFSVVQAAGRCNRSGKSNQGRVVIFSFEGNVAKSTALFETTSLLAEGYSLKDPDTPQVLYSRLLDTHDTDAGGVQELRKQLNYPEVARKYRLIRDQTVNIFVPYGDYESVLKRIINNEGDRHLVRRFSRFLVSVKEHELVSALEQGLAEELIDGIYLWTNKEPYSELFGAASVLMSQATSAC